MRHRRWVVVLAILIIAVLPLAFLGLKVASRHPAVQRAVLSRIMPEVAGDLTVGELEVGLASLLFSDVVVDFGGGSYVVIPSAAVNLSYAKLLFGGLAPERSISRIIVSDPRVVLSYGISAGDGAPGRAAGGDDSEEGERDGRPFDVASLEAFLPDYLGVSGAAVVFRDGRTGEELVCDSIDLLLERTDDGPVTGGAVGNCLGGTGNLEARFTWDSGSRTLSVDGALTGARLGEGIPVPPALPVELHSGTMTAAFRASASPDSIRGLAVGFEVLDAALTVTSVDERVSVAAARGRFQDGALTLSESSGTWRTSSWTAAGTVTPGTGAVEDARLEARAVPLGPLGALLGLGGHALTGSADVVAAAAGRMQSPIVTVSVGSAEAVVGNLPVSSVRAEATLSPGSVVVHDFTGSVFGGTLEAAGRLQRGMGAEQWDFEVFADALDLDAGRVMAYARGDTLSSGRVSITDIEGRGTLERPDLESLVRWDDLVLGPVRLGSGNGGFLLADGDLSASLGSSDRAFVATGTVSDLLGAPFVEGELELAALSVDTLLPGLGELRTASSVSGALSVSGPANDLALAGVLEVDGDYLRASAAVSGTFVLRETAGSLLTLTLESSDAAVRGVYAPFRADLRLNADELALTGVRVGDFAEADVRLGLGGNGELGAGLVISEAELENVLTALFGRTPEGLSGLVFASVSVHGTAAEPRASGQFTVAAASALGVPDLDLSAVARLDGGTLTVEELVLRESGRRVAGASGTAVLDGPLTMALTGEGVPGPLLGGEPGTRFDLDVGLGGTTDAPALDGVVTSVRGEFIGIPFDVFSAHVTGAGGFVRVDPLVLERTGSYRATAEGTVPYGAILGRDAAEGTLAVEVSGNPIALLSEFTGLATSGPGSGTMSAVLVGNGESLTLASARLEARAEYVRPVDVFERVDDLTASVTVLDGAVVDGAARGMIGGSELRVRSARRLTADGMGLLPLTGKGVDIGVLAFSTDERGVMANVPGLMLPDEYGRIAARGKDGAPEFLAAGPSPRPFFWGEMELSDLSLTYPLLESEEEDDGEKDFGDVLAESEWSARAVAGRNLWYWRPDANLVIERGSALDFVGVPAENTMCVSGRLTSNRGTLTYLHTEFDVRDVSVEFPAFCEPPRFHVEAETRVADGTTITLSMHTTEEVPALATSGVTLDESALVLASDSPDDNTPEKILAKLQYGVSYDLLEAEEQAALERRRAVELIGTQIGLRVARPLLAPIESRIRRNLNLDLVRIDIDFVEHFLSQLDMWTAQEGTAQYLPYAADTRMTLGKYISRDWLFSYQAILEPYEEELGDSRIGLRSELGIEYEVSRNTSLSLRVVYDPTLSGWDRRLAIENRYEF